MDHPKIPLMIWKRFSVNLSWWHLTIHPDDLHDLHPDLWYHHCCNYYYYYYCSTNRPLTLCIDYYLHCLAEWFCYTVAVHSYWMAIILVFDVFAFDLLTSKWENAVSLKKNVGFQIKRKQFESALTQISRTKSTMQCVTIWRDWRYTTGFYITKKYHSIDTNVNYTFCYFLYKSASYEILFWLQLICWCISHCFGSFCFTL